MTGKMTKFVFDLGAALDRIDAKYDEYEFVDGLVIDPKPDPAKKLRSTYKKLGDKSKRNTRFKPYEPVQFMIDADMMQIIRHEAAKRGKSPGMIANYLLWSGFFANRGDFRPPKNLTPK